MIASYEKKITLFRQRVLSRAAPVGRLMDLLGYRRSWSRDLQGLEIEGHRHQSAFARIQEMAAGRVAGIIAALDQEFSVARRQRLHDDCGLLPRIGGCRRNRENNRVAPRQDLGPVVIGIARLESRERLGTSSVRGDAPQAGRSADSEYDDVTLSPCPRQPRLAIRDLADHARQAAGKRYAFELWAVEERDRLTVGREEGAEPSVGSGKRFRLQFLETSHPKPVLIAKDDGPAVGRQRGELQPSFVLCRQGAVGPRQPRADDRSGLCLVPGGYERPHREDPDHDAGQDRAGRDQRRASIRAGLAL